MSEPRTQAKGLQQVVDGVGVYRWHLHDDRIDSQSDAYAVVDDKRVTLIDPLPIDPAELERLGNVETIVLTAANHQRSAWRFRKHFGAHVFAPVDAPNLEEEPDERYSSGDRLPWGILALQTPGPIESMHALWISSPRTVVFVSDLLAHDGSGTPRFIPSEYQDEPARTRMSVRRILEQIPVDIVCFAHGPPIVENGREALERALREDREEHPAAPAF